jgi:hypothetical protein
LQQIRCSVFGHWPRCRHRDLPIERPLIRWSSLLGNFSLPAPGVGRGTIKLLNPVAFGGGRLGGALPAFRQNLPAFPKIAGRDGLASDCVLSRPKNPRTECCCHPTVFIMAAIVTPARELLRGSLDGREIGTMICVERRRPAGVCRSPIFQRR